MISISHLFALLLLASTIHAEYGPGDTPAAATAGTCALGCVEYAYGYNGVIFGCNSNYMASCLCNTANGHSSSMDVSISLCPTADACGGSPEATQGLLIFSEYCSMNLIGVAIPTITQTVASTASAGSPGITPFATSVPTQTTSSTSSNNSSGGSSSNSLSTSDKIAIACAIGGALVTIGVAVPTWLHMRKKKRQENASEAEPLHAMPQYNHNMYPMPAQQPFFAKPQPQVYYHPQQQNRWGWSNWGW